jgi:hypothetical protein
LKPGALFPAFNCIMFVYFVIMGKFTKFES